MLRLLCVTAHPDDEAGCFGGVLSKYSEAGVECSVICLTAGERAANRLHAANDSELKAIRSKEFADSCHHLGVANCKVLDYTDGALDRADFYEVTGRLVHFIRVLRPHVVLSFGADGFVTAHPDHGMAGLFTAAAFQWAARKNRYTNQLEHGLSPWKARKLYSVTTEFSLQERPSVSLAPVTARISVEPYIDRKIEAFAKHTSQLVLLPIFDHAQRQAGVYELFHLVATAEVTSMGMESDLFAGIREL
ncbi:MAG: PIG-L family deacetylase [Acidobacteria bacterium]|nr:MAG: PIG-L family deacetylase [Acidobacteriota bacterium]